MIKLIVMVAALSLTAPAMAGQSYDEAMNCALKTTWASASMRKMGAPIQEIKKLHDAYMAQIRFIGASEGKTDDAVRDDYFAQIMKMQSEVNAVAPEDRQARQLAMLNEVRVCASRVENTGVSK